MSNSTSVTTKKWVLTALFTALVSVATMIIKIPTAGTGGYIHLGDAFVILSGIILGPVYGGLAAGIGSALADLIGGYMLYVPITFVIKGVIGLLSGLIYNKFMVQKISATIRCILCGIVATVLVAGGYLLFEIFFYGAAALSSVPQNIIQGLSGLVIATILHPALKKAIIVTTSS